MKYESYWQLFLEKERTFYDIAERKYLKKGYLHFDNRIWFPDFESAFKKYIFESKNVENHAFLPFLKVVLETKRIKNNPKRHKRKLEIKERPICYAAHFDALIYSFYATVLSEKYESYVQANELDANALAYRSLNLCNIDFAEEVFKFIEDRQECVAIALDIKGFFDNLDHDILKNNWIRVLSVGEEKPFIKLPPDQFQVYRSLTRFAYVERTNLLKVLGISESYLSKNKLQRYCDIKEFRDKVKKHTAAPLEINRNKFGIPQGSPISAVLSNVYMIDYDKTFAKMAKEMKFIYRRYCDDIIVVCDAKDFEHVRAKLYEEIEALKLTIQPEKEEIVFFKGKDGALRGYDDALAFKNLQYLGFEFNGQNRYLRSSSLSRYYRRMKAACRETVKRAYGNRGKGRMIYKKKLYDRFTHLGAQNFITYALRAADIMDSDTIRKQISSHFDQLKDTLNSKENKYLRRKVRKRRKAV